MKLFKGNNEKDDLSKDIIYISIIDAIDENGCPICRLVEKSE